jgi:hypothetical protein
MIILLTIHSILRWAAVLVAAALIIRLVFGIIQKKPFDKLAIGLTAAFAGVMDLQATLGLLYFLVDGFGGAGFNRLRWEHAVMLTLAVALAHLPATWKKQPDQIRSRNTLIAVIVALAFIVVGVSRLGLSRWLHIIGLF